MTLAAQGRVSLTPLVTHRFPIEQVDKAFELLDRMPAPGDVVQAVIEF